MSRYTKKKFKSVLIVRKQIDSWFWDKYGINGYNGCEHACLYCDSRSAKYHLPGDFANDIVVKEDIAVMLDERLSKSRKLLPDVVAMSGASDPYHPAEGIYKNTLKCLEVLRKHKFPVHIITKSPLVLRDLDILDQIGKDTWCTVSVTVTVSDEETAQFLEPRAVSPRERFNIISEIKEKSKHIQTGVLLIPVIPVLGDSLSKLQDHVIKTKQSKADYLLFGGAMTLRDQQAKWYLNHLASKYPEAIREYEKIYQFTYQPEGYTGKYSAAQTYNKSVNLNILQLCKNTGLDIAIKRFLPQDFRYYNYSISEKILNEARIEFLLGKNKTEWYVDGLRIQELNDSIHNLFLMNQLGTLPFVNENLEIFINNEFNKDSS